MFQGLNFRGFGLWMACLTIGASMLGCSNGPQVRQVSEEKSLVTTGLDIQDFRAAATELTNKMLAAPRVQEQMAMIQQQTGKRPYVKISRIRNDTTLKINMVDYLVSPIEEVLINSGKADSYSEDRNSQQMAAAQDMLNGSQPRLPNFVLYGVVSRLSTSSGDTRQNAYKFELRLTDTATNTVFFIGSAEPNIKQRSKSGVSL